MQANWWQTGTLKGHFATDCVGCVFQHQGGRYCTQMLHVTVAWTLETGCVASHVGTGPVHQPPRRYALIWGWDTLQGVLENQKVAGTRDLSLVTDGVQGTSTFAPHLHFRPSQPQRKWCPESQILAGGRGLGHFNNGLQGKVCIIIPHLHLCPSLSLQVVLKSQILAGGRGLGRFTNGLQGGVHI